MSKYGIFVLGAAAVAAAAVLAHKRGGKKMKKSTYNISLKLGSESGGWIATSDDVPGLVLEAESLDSLKEQLELAVPMLLKLNKVAYDSK